MPPVVEMCDLVWSADDEGIDRVIGSEPNGEIELRAGKDGAQKDVPVPVGHWIVRQPGDLSDHWPVDPDYFARKYEVFSPGMRVSLDDACEASDHPNAKPHPMFPERGVCECGEAMYDQPPEGRSRGISSSEASSRGDVDYREETITLSCRPCNVTYQFTGDAGSCAEESGEFYLGHGGCR